MKRENVIRLFDKLQWMVIIVETVCVCGVLVVVRAYTWKWYAKMVETKIIIIIDSERRMPCHIFLAGWILFCPLSTPPNFQFKICSLTQTRRVFTPADWCWCWCLCWCWFMFFASHIFLFQFFWRRWWLLLLLLFCFRKLVSCKNINAKLSSS